MRKFWFQLVQMGRLMVGQQDYDIYVARRRQFGANQKIMSREEFFEHCQKARYGGKSMKKCPC